MALEQVHMHTVSELQDATADMAANALTTPKPLISLSSWVSRTYEAADAPHLNTVRRWVKRNLIQPAPQKQGREYFFSPDARYCATDEKGGAL